MATHEREITEPVDLCRADGRLDPASVGWTRVPLHRANLAGWGRRKRWEYWGIVTPTHMVGVTVASLDYVGLYEIHVVDRASGRELARKALAPFARGAVLPERSGVGTASAHWRDVSITLASGPEGTSVRASARRVEIDLQVGLRPDHESVGVVIPWGENRFQYTVKDVSRPVSGRIRLDGAEHRVPEGESFAVLDHGRGKWPYAITWNWAAGSGPDGRGIQLGGTWTDGTGMTENALLVGDRVHKIGEPLAWASDPGDPFGPWRITSQRVGVDFHPSHRSTSRTNAGIVASRIDRRMGEFTGWVLTDDDERVSVDGLVGWAEEARHRW